MVSIFFETFCNRGSQNFDHDYDDDGEPLNKNYKFDKFPVVN